jgi:hypothetical protein
MSALCSSPQELIHSCNVVDEMSFKDAIMATYKRRKRYMWMGTDKQNDHGNKVFKSGTKSKAAWFDLNWLRMTSNGSIKGNCYTWVKYHQVCGIATLAPMSAMLCGVDRKGGGRALRTKPARLNGLCCASLGG